MSQFEMNAADFFAEPATAIPQFESLVFDLFRSKGALQIVFGDQINLRVVENKGRFIFTGAVAGPFRALAGRPVNNIFCPMLLDTNTLELPHDSLSIVGGADISVGTITLQSLFMGSLRGFNSEMVNSQEQWPAVRMHYFYYLRSKYPEDFSRSKTAQAECVANMLCKITLLKNPLLEAQAMGMRTEVYEAQPELDDRDNQNELSRLRNALMEII